MSSSTLPPTCTLIHANGEPCSICKELEDVESQIVHAARHLATLESKRINLISALNALNDRIIGRLPFEIASYIFQIYLEVRVKSTNPGGVFPKNWMTDAPFRLGAVCRRWRAIAWASPTLWTSFSICLYPPWNENMLELAKEWLGRTGSFPLSIRVCESGRNYDDGIDEEHEEIHGKVIDVVNSVSSCWESLDIELEPPLLRKFRSSNNPANHAPSILQRISLTDSSASESFEVHEFLLNNPGYSPSHLRLTRVLLGGSLGDLNWTNIASFEAHYMSIEDCLLVIQAAPRLTVFVVGQVEEVNATSHTMITHPGLRSLRFIWTGDVSIRQLLDRLILPSFESLSSNREFDIFDNLISLIDRSSCHFNLLHVDFCHASNHELRIRLLRSMPSLKILVLNFDRDSDLALFLEDLWKIKLDDSGSSTFLPKLTTFMTAYVSDLPFKALMDVFESSQTSQSFPLGKSHMASIRSLHFHFILLGEIFYINRDTTQRLTKFIAQGFNISISTRYGEDIIAKSSAIHFPRAESL